VCVLKSCITFGWKPTVLAPGSGGRWNVTVFFDLADAGLKINWRRSFITTDVNPFYDSFIQAVTPLSLSSSRKRIKKISFICERKFDVASLDEHLSIVIETHHRHKCIIAYACKTSVNLVHDSAMLMRAELLERNVSIPSHSTAGAPVARTCASTAPLNVHCHRY